MQRLYHNIAKNLCLTGLLFGLTTVQASDELNDLASEIKITHQLVLPKEIPEYIRKFSAPRKGPQALPSHTPLEIRYIKKSEFLYNLSLFSPHAKSIVATNDDTKEYQISLTFNAEGRLQNFRTDNFIPAARIIWNNPAKGQTIIHFFHMELSITENSNMVSRVSMESQ